MRPSGKSLLAGPDLTGGEGSNLVVGGVAAGGDVVDELACTCYRRETGSRPASLGVSSRVGSPASLSSPAWMMTFLSLAHLRRSP